MILKTERLILRQWTAEDFAPFAEMQADPAVTEFLSADGKPLPRFLAWQAFCAIVGHWHLRGFGMYAVIERSSREFVGRVGPWYPEGWPDFEIGWSLKSKFWGRGYATEAARRCVEHSFTQLGRNHVESYIHEGNVRSIRVAERLGERADGTVVLSHIPTLPVLRYVLNKADWRPE